MSPIKVFTMVTLVVFVVACGEAEKTTSCERLNNRVDELNGDNRELTIEGIFPTSNELKVTYVKNSGAPDNHLQLWWEPFADNTLLVDSETESGESSFIAAPENAESIYMRIQGTIDSETSWTITYECR